MAQKKGLPPIPALDSSFLKGLSTENRVAILNATFDRLYEYNRYLRDRVLAVSTAAITLLLAADGWCINIALERPLPHRLRIIFLAAAIVILATAWWSIHAHWREFVGSAAMIVSLETALGFYTENEYLPNSTLYTPESRYWAQGRYTSHILFTDLATVFTFALASVLLIWTL